MSRTKSRAAGLCACAADSGGTRSFSRANRRDAAPVARGRQVSIEIQRERFPDRPSASQHGESPRHVCPRTLERAAHTMAVTASNLRVTPAIAAMQRAPRACRAAAVVRGGCASSSGAPAQSSAKLSARRAVAGGAAARLARESRLSLALRAPARARTSVVRSAHASVSSPRPHGTRAAPSRPRGPSLSVAIVIRGALSRRASLVRNELAV